MTRLSKSTTPSPSTSAGNFANGAILARPSSSATGVDVTGMSVI